MEARVVELQRHRSFRGGDAYEVFTDHGSGSMDTQTPVSDRPRRIWDGLPLFGGHLLIGHLVGLHLDHVIPDGHLAGRHLTAEHLWHAALLRFITPPLYFGLFRFAVGRVDSVGNRSATLSPAAEAIVNSSPRRASGLQRAGFDVSARRMSFTFTPSLDL